MWVEAGVRQGWRNRNLVARDLATIHNLCFLLGVGWHRCTAFVLG